MCIFKNTYFIDIQLIYNVVLISVVQKRDFTTTYIHCYCCAQSNLTLCDPMNCSLPSSSVHEISQAGILQWVAISYSRVSSQPRDRTHVSCVSAWAGRFFTTAPSGKPYTCIYIIPFHF